MTWLPAPGWVIVSRSEIDDRHGSLYLPKSAVAQAAGWVCDVVRSGGPPPMDEDAEPRTWPDVQPGDWILTPPRRTIEVDEEGLLLLPITEIWAVIR